MGTEHEKLRDELIGMETIIAEFQKWKLIGLGAVFAAGLGLSDSKIVGVSAILALFAVPVVTIYADLLISDYIVRLSLIASYMLRSGGPYSRYERFLHEKGGKRTFLWLFGHVAIALSSVVANGAVLLLVLCTGLAKKGTTEYRILMWGSGIGLVLCLVIQFVFWRVSLKIFDGKTLVLPPETDTSP